MGWGLLLLFLAGCGVSATPEPSPTPTLPPTLAPTASFTPTLPPTAVLPTATLSPSPLPSQTPPPSTTPTGVPSATLAPTLTAVPPTPKPTAVDFTPQLVSVWNTTIVGSDSMKGTCSNPVNPVYGLVQITPQGNTLVWKNQEPAPYTMARVRANVWQYAGPTSIGDGTVTMVVQFNSATTLGLTRTFVPSAEPNCTHVHSYSGVFQWNR
jgi:hypothetical protein